MPKLTFVYADGKELNVEVPNGISVLEAAHKNAVSLEGACEGSLACSTCHVIVDKEWYDKLKPATEDEEDMLDLAFALNPTPARALSITFTKPMMIHPFGAILKPGMEAKTWADINKPDVRIVVDRGSAHDVAAHRFAPKAQIIVVDKPDEAVLTMLSGRADVNILAAMLALSTLGKNPALGHFVLLGSPLFALPSCIGLRREADTRLKEVVDAWLDMARGTGQVREWLIAGIEMTGAKRADIPADLSF